MKTRQNYKRAFTLVELLTVVVISLIITALAVGSYAGMKQRRSLRAATDSVESVFNSTRSYAVSRNTWYRVTFQLRDPNSNTPMFQYWIDEIPPLTSNIPNPVVPDAAVQSRLITPQQLPEGVDFVGATIQGAPYDRTNSDFLVVRFFPNGASDSAQFTFQEPSQSKSGPLTAQVQLFPATGKPTTIAAAP